MSPELADLETKQIEISKINMVDGNPRLHPDQQLDMLGASFRKFKFIGPVIITTDYTLVAGEGCIKAALKAGMTKVNACIVSHLTDAQIRAYRIASNRLAEKGEWSLDLLAKELELISEIDLDFEPLSLGYETGEVDQLILVAKAPKPDEEPEIVAEPDRAQTAVARVGDIFRIGRHTIACGDSTNLAFVKQVMGGKLADAVITDQPWNLPASFIGGKGKIKHPNFHMASGEMSPEQFREFTEKALEVQSAVAKPGALILQFIDWRSTDVMIAAGKAKIGPLIAICIWVKPTPAMGAPWRSQHEMIPVFRKEGGKAKNNVQLGKYGRNRSNVWQYPAPNSWGSERHKLQMHPTAKNESMIADAILDITDRNDVVFDGFLGSGTTALAAQAVGRICVGVELDGHYADLAITRLVAATGEPAVHANGMCWDELRESRFAPEGQTDGGQ